MRIFANDCNLFLSPYVIQTHNCSQNLSWEEVLTRLQPVRLTTRFSGSVYNTISEQSKKVLSGNAFTFDAATSEISCADTIKPYLGRRNDLDILPRLLYKANRRNAFETHLQAYIMQNFDSILFNDLIPLKECPVWIGNEVSCGVGM